MLIYQVTNLLNGKIYVGQTTKTLEVRFAQHMQLNRKRSCRLLQLAIRKYGALNFVIEALQCAIHKGYLNELESYWIKKLESFGPKGYNLTSGGDRAELAEESREMIRQKLLGKPTGRMGIPTGQTPWNKGKAWSPEMRQKLSAAHIGIKRGPGKPWSDEAKRAHSERRKGRPIPALRKPVMCVETGAVYESGRAAAAMLGLQASKICLVLKGLRPHTRGLTFVYVNR